MRESLVAFSPATGYYISPPPSPSSELPTKTHFRCEMLRTTVAAPPDKHTKNRGGKKTLKNTE